MTDTVFTSKSREDAAAGLSILDRERGVVDTISERPWQTDTCIGNWHYHKKIYEENRYKTPKFVVDLLVDIVSRNGNLMLNVPLPNNGMPDEKELKVIEGITQWMAVNREAIHGTRPWKIFGASPGRGAEGGPRTALPGERPQGFHRPGCPLHHQGFHTLHVLHGLACPEFRRRARERNRDRGARHHEHACGGKYREGGAP